MMNFRHCSSSNEKSHNSITTGTLGTILTPDIIIRTYVGNVMYGTPDGLHELCGSHLGQLELSEVCHKEFGAELSLKDLYKTAQSLEVVRTLSCRHMTSKVHSADAAGIKVDSSGVRKLFTLVDYERTIATHQPPVVLGFADEVAATAGSKRLAKAMDRTSAWHKKLMSSTVIDWNKTFYFGIAIANTLMFPQQLTDRVVELLNSGARGIVCGGVHMGESEEQRHEIIRRIKNTCKDYKKTASSEAVEATSIGTGSANSAAECMDSVPVLVQGSDTVPHIIADIRSGADIVSTNYPKINTMKGHAVVVNWNKYLNNSSEGLPPVVDVINPDSNSSSTSNTAGSETSSDKIAPISSAASGDKKRSYQQFNNEQQFSKYVATGAEAESTIDTPPTCKKQKNKGNGAGLNNVSANCITGSANDPTDGLSLNLWNEVYRKDTKPLVSIWRLCSSFLLNHEFVY